MAVNYSKLTGNVSRHKSIFFAKKMKHRINPSRGNFTCKTFARVDGTKPVPPKMQVSRNICAVMGGPRFVAARFCNCLTRHSSLITGDFAAPVFRPDTLNTPDTLNPPDTLNQPNTLTRLFRLAGTLGFHAELRRFEFDRTCERSIDAESDMGDCLGKRDFAVDREYVALASLA